MALRAVLDSLEGVEESLHEHYTEKTETQDNKQVTRYYLDITDDIRQHPKGKTLKAALDRVKEEKTTLVTKLEEIEAKMAELPENFDAEQFAKDMDELAQLRKKLEDDEGSKGKNKEHDEQAQSLKKLYEQRITKLEEKYSAQILELEKQKKDLEAELERLVADEGLVKHLHSVGVDKKMMPAVTAYLRKSVRVRQDEEGKRQPIVETSDGEVMLEEFISSWAQSDEGAVYIEKPKGGGAPGAEGGRTFNDNPWINDPKNGRTPNLTRQQQIMTANPTKAKQMMQAAGRPQNEIDQAFGSMAQ